MVDNKSLQKDKGGETLNGSDTDNLADYSDRIYSDGVRAGMSNSSSLPPRAVFEPSKTNSVTLRVQEFRRAYQEAANKELLMRKASLTASNLQSIKKVAIHIKLDDDVIDFFKKEGPGYQTRINCFLRKALDED